MHSYTGLHPCCGPVEVQPLGVNTVESWRSPQLRRRGVIITVVPAGLRNSRNSRSHIMAMIPRGSTGRRDSMGGAQKSNGRSRRLITAEMRRTIRNVKCGEFVDGTRESSVCPEQERSVFYKISIADSVTMEGLSMSGICPRPKPEHKGGNSWPVTKSSVKPNRAACKLSTETQRAIDDNNARQLRP